MPQRANGQIPPAHARIDHTHPLARGLLFAYHAGAVFSCDYSSSGNGGFLIWNGGRRSQLVYGKRNGDCYETSGTQGSTHIGVLKTGEEATIFIQAQWDTGGGNSFARFFANAQVDVITPSNSALEFHRICSSGSAWCGLSGITNAPTEWQSIGASFPNSNAATDISIYLNGQPRTPTATTPSANPPANNNTLTNWFIHDNGFGNGRVVDGRSRCIYYWNRLLSPAEHRYLAANPFCIWTWSGISDAQRVAYGSGSAEVVVETAKGGVEALVIKLGSGASAISLSSSANALKHLLGQGASDVSVVCSAGGLLEIHGAGTPSITVTGASGGSVKTYGATWIHSIDTGRRIKSLYLTNRSTKLLKYKVTDLPAGRSIVKSRLMIKRDWNDADNAAVLTKTITSAVGGAGVIANDGSNPLVNASLEFLIDDDDLLGLPVDSEYILGVKSILDNGLAYVHSRTVTRVQVLAAMVESV